MRTAIRRPCRQIRFLRCARRSSCCRGAARWPPAGTGGCWRSRRRRHGRGGGRFPTSFSVLDVGRRQQRDRAERVGAAQLGQDAALGGPLQDRHRADADPADEALRASQQHLLVLDLRKFLQGGFVPLHILLLTLDVWLPLLLGEGIEDLLGILSFGGRVAFFRRNRLALGFKFLVGPRLLPNAIVEATLPGKLRLLGGLDLGLVRDDADATDAVSAAEVIDFHAPAPLSSSAHHPHPLAGQGHSHAHA
mmetsp:Transcript_34615/g.112612  ORF Transcript_34615/g.112612 Transcript_34615/m.112612 type:complete len:249 (-) Transcript_34615:4736-5482(-)